MTKFNQAYSMTKRPPVCRYQDICSVGYINMCIYIYKDPVLSMVILSSFVVMCAQLCGFNYVVKVVDLWPIACNCTTKSCQRWDSNSEVKALWKLRICGNTDCSTKKNTGIKKDNGTGHNNSVGETKTKTGYILQYFKHGKQVSSLLVAYKCEHA